MTRALQTSAALAAGLLAVLLAMVAGLAARDPAALGFGGWSAPSLPDLSPRLPAVLAPRAQGPDGITQGLFSGVEGAPDLAFSRAEVAIGDSEPFVTSPARILAGDDRWNAQGGRIADLLATPRDAQVELRRIAGSAPACALDRPAAWVLIAHESRSVSVALLSEAPGPDTPAAALCAVHRAAR